MNTLPIADTLKEKICYDKYREAVTSYCHSFLITIDGDVYTVGDNSSGQLGIGNHTSHTRPVRIETLPPIFQISAGYVHTLFLAEAGNVYAVGDNSGGQLGIGSHNNRSRPVQLKSTSHHADFSG